MDSGGLLRKHNHVKYSFDYINNRSNDPTIVEAQFAYYSWTEAKKENQEIVDRKENGIRDYWTGIYQIIGFYSVFQGVIFQGVTSMATELSCGFYKIPIILSVLASAATFVGIYIKFDNILGLKESLIQDVMVSKGLEDRIDFCDFQYADVSEFDILTVDKGRPDSSAYGEGIKKQKDEANVLKWGSLGFLITFSGLFAYLDFVVMCKGYH